LENYVFYKIKPKVSSNKGEESAKKFHLFHKFPLIMIQQFHSLKKWDCVNWKLDIIIWTYKDKREYHKSLEKFMDTRNINYVQVDYKDLVINKYTEVINNKNKARFFEISNRNYMYWTKLIWDKDFHSEIIQSIVDTTTNLNVSICYSIIPLEKKHQDIIKKKINLIENKYKTKNWTKDKNQTDTAIINGLNKKLDNELFTLSIKLLVWESEHVQSNEEIEKLINEKIEVIKSNFSFIENSVIFKEINKDDFNILHPYTSFLNIFYKSRKNNKSW